MTRYTILTRYVGGAEVEVVHEVSREVVHVVVLEVAREAEAAPGVRERPQNQQVISNLG
jgi:hypothetical protein